MTHQPAQVNLALLHRPMKHPQIREFVDGLAPINALSEARPGFIWHLQDEGSSVAHDPDSMLLGNFSVWQSVERLRAFSHSGPQLEFLRRGREWFSRLATPHFCM